MANERIGFWDVVHSNAEVVGATVGVSVIAVCITVGCVAQMYAPPKPVETITTIKTQGVSP